MSQMKPLICLYSKSSIKVVTFSIFTAKLKAPPNGLLRHTGECREMISAGHTERASESEPSDYENCSSSDASLGTDVGHLPMKPYIIMDAICNR